MKKENLLSWLFVFVVVVLPITVYGIVKWYEHKFEKLPVFGPDNHVVNGFRFINQHGKIVTEKEWRDKIVVANYFFTSCSVVCPKMVNNLKRVQAYSSKDIVFTSFSVDPERDSAARMNNYAVKFGIKDNWFLLTGNKRELYRFARKDLLLVATDGDGGPDDFIHSENLVLIDKNKKIRGFYKGTDEAEVNQLVKDIKKLVEEG